MKTSRDRKNEKGYILANKDEFMLNVMEVVGAVIYCTQFIGFRSLRVG